MLCFGDQLNEKERGVPEISVVVFGLVFMLRSDVFRDAYVTDTVRNRLEWICFIFIFVWKSYILAIIDGKGNSPYDIKVKEECY